MNVTDAHSLFPQLEQHFRGRAEYAYQEGQGPRGGPFIFDGELVLWRDHNPPTVVELRDWLAANGATLVSIQTTVFALSEDHPTCTDDFNAVGVDGWNPHGANTWSIRYRVPFTPALAALADSKHP